MVKNNNYNYFMKLALEEATIYFAKLKQMPLKQFKKLKELILKLVLD